MPPCRMPASFITSGCTRPRSLCERASLLARAHKYKLQKHSDQLQAKDLLAEQLAYLLAAKLASFLGS